MDANVHMNEEEIERYSMGALPEEDTARFEEHLLVCESCRHRLAEADVYVAAMRRASARARQEALEPRPRWLRVPRLVPALAGLAVLLVAAGLWLGHLGTGEAHPFTVGLEATRGASVQAKAPAGRWLLLRLDLANLPVSSWYGIEMVDRFGNTVWQASVAAQGSKASSKVPGSPPGTYFVRIHGPSGELLREYALEVESRR